ncbi:MAG: hypothetical protein AB7E60_01910 [Sphingobium sp.]
MVDAAKVLLGKKETTYATDAAPTGAANAILTRNFSTKPVESDRLERNLDQRIFGARASAATSQRRTMSFEVELAGSGAAGTAPPWMELLEACGMAAPVVTAGVSAAQGFAAPGAAASSLTLHDYMADQRRKTVGAVGTFSIDLTAGAYGFFGFQMTGLIPATAPFDKSAAPASTLTRWKQPQEVNVDNTTVSLDGYSCIMRSWRAEAGVDVALRNLVGSRYVRRGNHNLTSTLLIEAPDVATKDYIARLRANDLVAFGLTHGALAGGTTAFASPKVQIADIVESEENDILMWSLSLIHTVDGGSPDLTITAT